MVSRLLGRGGAGGGALPLPPLGPRIWKRELRREGVRVLGVRKLRGAKGGLSGARGAYLSWRRPCAASSPAHAAAEEAEVVGARRVCPRVRGPRRLVGSHVRWQ